MAFSAADSERVTFNLQKAANLHLANKKIWQRLLFFDERFGGRHKSLVADPQYFLSPQGRTQPAKELEATIRAFLNQTQVEREGQFYAPSCVWPSRYAWLAKELGFKEQGIQAPACPKLEEFLTYARYGKISLVFSNYFLNSPASMFGHTFFRMHKRVDATSPMQADLLDDIVNFSAFIYDMGSPLYPLKGLFGVYQGKFAMVPYYIKIQEYNNLESRDLWEYELKLTQEQIDFIVLRLWELGGTYLKYYYLDDNCAFILLTLLETSDEKLELTKDFGLYAIPSDTLKTVVDKNLVKNIVYRPSSLSRFFARYEQLTGSEKAIIQGILSAKDRGDRVTQKLAFFDSKTQAHVADTLVEFIDYKEKNIDLEKVGPYSELRQKILIQRSKNREAPANISAFRGSSQPELGHRSSLYALGLGYSTQNFGYIDLHWRPALHDLSSDSAGYSDEMAIDFLNVDARVYQHFFDVHEINFIRILSLAHERDLVEPWAWHLNLAYKNIESFSIDKKTFFFEGEFGKDFLIVPEQRLSFFALVGAGAGIFWQTGVWLAPSVLLGLKTDLSAGLRLVSDMTYRYGLQTEKNYAFQSLDFRTALTQTLKEGTELRGLIEYGQSSLWSYTLSLSIYH